MLTKRKLPALHRTETFEIREVERAEGDEKARKRYRISISSETPVQRWFGLEVLSHKKSAIDLSRAKRGLAVRDGHYGDQVGIAEEFTVEDGRLRAEILFSENPRPQEIERDVTSDPPIRRFVSVGYIVQRAQLVEKGGGEKPDKWEVTRWQPLHVAFVPDPADYSVGVGREKAGEETFPVEFEGGEPAEEGRSMCEKCKQATCVCAPAGREAAPGQGAPQATAVATREAGGSPPSVEVGRGQRDKEVAAIVRLCQAHGVSERAPEFIEKGLSEIQVSHEILKLRHTNGAAQPASETPPAPTALSAKDARRYSYSRAILAMDGGKFDGLEREVHDEITKNLPKTYRAMGGVFIPMALRGESNRQAILREAIAAWLGEPGAGQRALDSKTAGAGTETVFDQPGGLIELLRNNTVVLRSGARLLTGLTAPIAFTKQTGAATGYWVGENSGSDVTESQLATGIITLTPKTLQASTSFSRQLLVLSNEDSERMVREDLAAVHAIAIDRAAYHGQGAAGEPMGIYYAPDVIAKAMGGAADWVKIVDMVAQCADKNALDGSLGWVATALLAGRYMTIPRISGAAAGFLWEGTVREGTMAGYPGRSTTQLSKLMSGSDPTGGTSHGLIFANWADLIIGMWGALEMIPDPYAKKKQGLIELTTFQMVDEILRHGESFVKATGATTA